MKRTYLILIVLSVALAGCHNKQKKETSTPEPQEPKDTTIIAGVYHFQFGDVEFWTLQDKSNTMSMDLFPGADKKIVKELVPTGEADAAVNAFLLKRNGKYILFDAGLGLDKGSAIMDQLVMLGIQDSDISAVCITHFHGDHIGGMLTNGDASFPKATVYCSAEEVKAWKTDKGVQKMLAAYEGRVQTFNGGETILGDIVTKAAPGHTPGHTLYQVGSVLIIGDLLHAAAL